jgi:hypothetical protein
MFAGRASVLKVGTTVVSERVPPSACGVPPGRFYYEL